MAVVPYILIKKEQNDFCIYTTFEYIKKNNNKDFGLHTTKRRVIKADKMSYKFTCSRRLVR